MEKRQYKSPRGECIAHLMAAGFREADAVALRKHAMTLHGWDEQCCGMSDASKSWCIVRDDETRAPFREVHPHRGESFREPIADRERHAIRAIAKVMAEHPDWVWFHQTDPRGASLYIIRKGDIPEGRKASEFYTRGIAVYK
jgi:hypothetical protein